MRSLVLYKTFFGADQPFFLKSKGRIFNKSRVSFKSAFHIIELIRKTYVSFVFYLIKNKSEKVTLFQSNYIT